MNFIRKKPEQIEKIKLPSHWKKKLLLFLGILGITLLILWQILGIVININKSWNEIAFAYNKPQLVRAVREEYSKKQQELDNQFMQKQQTAEQKLIEAVADQLKTSK